MQASFPTTQVNTGFKQSELHAGTHVPALLTPWESFPTWFAASQEADPGGSQVTEPGRWLGSDLCAASGYGGGGLLPLPGCRLCSLCGRMALTSRGLEPQQSQVRRQSFTPEALESEMRP